MRKQLIVALGIAILLGLIIMSVVRCGTSGSSTTTARRTPVVTRTGSVTAVPSRATDVAIAPPGAFAPTPTPISVGPLPPTTGTTQTTTVGTQFPPTPTPLAALPALATPTPRPATPAQPAATAVPAGSTIYEVKAGDQLGAIAKKFGVSTTDIMKANNITDPNMIRTGQKLIIPGVVSPTATPSPVRTHIVQRGENLSSIAVKYKTTVSAIAKANNITNPNLIRPGQKLIIP